MSGHIHLGHPVIVSTDHLPSHHGVVHRRCCHMWLALSLDQASNLATVHDSGNDELFEIEISAPTQVACMGNNVEFDLGLRGRFTLTNYFCLAFWAQ